ncbi:hypothetical protein B296_00023573 [Ensete ventricosum]|uniref:Uncharacterized protein n=1 Tax=Ensete ventricosum TaxID=4639 RepID=A0A426YZG2_ENSVE|nr:hypothetical protein B296_00023573 [Ensete ventricosum]
MLSETEERLSRHDGRPEARRDGREPRVRGSKPRVIEQPPVTIRSRKSANVGGGQNFLRGLMLPQGSSTQSSIGWSLGPSRGWRSCTQASLEVGGVTQRGPSDAQVSKNPEWPSREGKVWSIGEKKVRSSERKLPLTCCRSKCFILVGGELARTPSLTFVVPRNMAETYGGHVAWGVGMARHATLMGVGSVVFGHLHLGLQIGCRLGPSG